MQNIIINNASDNATIDIIGDIGEGFFDEGVTIESVLSQLQQIKTKNITLNISSLGGDVNHALAIHDAIKMHPSKVTAKITGMTASSGTIIAMAADEVQMSENAFFLIHNVWTGIKGNQHDLRELADELEKFDEVLSRMYAKKTGKRKSQMLSLMAEEKWLNAYEAQELGFVDKVFAPMAIAASIINNINESNYLPKFNNNKMKEQFEELKNFITELFNNKKEVVIEEEVIESNEELKNEFNAKVNELEVLRAEELAVKENEFNAKLEEKENSFNAEKEELNAKFENSIKEVEELKAKIESLETELSKSESKASAPKAKSEVELSLNDVKETPLQRELKAAAKAVKNTTIINK